MLIFTCSLKTFFLNLERHLYSIQLSSQCTGKIAQLYQLSRQWTGNIAQLYQLSSQWTGNIAQLYQPSSGNIAVVPTAQW